MEFNEYPIIICGSGISIPFDNEKGIPLELKNVIENNVSMGINWFNYFGCETTLLTFVDNSQNSNFIKKAGDWLDNVPFIVGRYSSIIENMIGKNTILIPKGDRYMGEDALYFNKKICLKCKTKYSKSEPNTFCQKCERVKLWNCGVFPCHLSGLFSLSLAIALGFKDIFLLGCDCTGINGKTHFYQDLLKPEQMKNNGNFSGVGTRLIHNKPQYSTSGYNSSKKSKLNEDDSRYGAFRDYGKLGIKIYNVSLISSIDLFPKLSYGEFYDLIGYQSVNQDNIRQEIRSYIDEKQKS